MSAKITGEVVTLNGRPLVGARISWAPSASKPEPAGAPVTYIGTFEIEATSASAFIDKLAELCGPPLVIIEMDGVPLWAHPAIESEGGFSCDLIDCGTGVGAFVWWVYAIVLPIEELAIVASRQFEDAP